jgi:glutamate dehydrogenase
MDGAIGLARLAGDIAQNELEVATAFTHLGETLGIDWLQGQAARMTPSDPWERMLVTGSARDLQQMRLTFLARAQYKPVGAYLEHWIGAHDGAIQQFRQLVSRARAAPSTSAAMVAELSTQARALLER